MKLHSSTARGLLATIILPSAVLTMAASTHAGLVTWGAATAISGDSNVSTNGILVGAFNIGQTGVASTTVNGTLFTALPLTGTSVTSGNFTLSNGATPLTFSNAVGSGAAPFSLLTAQYQALLSSVGGSIAGSPTILTMSGLVAGANYEFEWWSNLSNGTVFITTATAGGAVALNSNPTGLAGGVGQYAIGTFVADATKVQTIQFTIANTGATAINGFQLRLVPEPGTALVGVALLGVCGMQRRRRAMGGVPR